MTYDDGSSYEGEFNRNKKSGKGLMKYVNGDQYEG